MKFASSFACFGNRNTHKKVSLLLFSPICQSDSWQVSYDSQYYIVGGSVEYSLIACSVKLDVEMRFSSLKLIDVALILLTLHYCDTPGH